MGLAYVDPALDRIFASYYAVVGILKTTDPKVRSAKLKTTIANFMPLFKTRPMNSIRFEEFMNKKFQPEVALPQRAAQNIEMIDEEESVFAEETDPSG